MNPCLVPRLLIALALVGLAGCRVPGGSGPVQTALPAATKPNSFDRLVRGQSAGEVLALVGKPHAIKPVRQGGAEGESWQYLLKVDEAVRQVPIATREVPAINPLTGQSITILEPVLADEFTTLYHDITLLLFDGRLVEISRRPRVEKNIH